MKKKHSDSIENLYQRRDVSTTQQLEVTRQLVMLQTASAQISSSLDVNEVCSIVTRELNNIFSTRVCILSRWNKENGTLYRVATHMMGSHIKEIEDSSFRLSDFPLRKQALDGQRVIQSISSDPKIDSAEKKFLKKHGYKSVLLLPLVHQNEAIGLIETYDLEERIYEIHEIVLAKLYANHASIAIENARLFDRAQEEIDIRKQVEEKLRYDALHDGLTGLPNRNLFLDRLERVILRAKRFPEVKFAVLYLDLDRFKRINDTFGHTEGDRVLIEVAHILQSCVREIDTVSRFGGDEFLILIEGKIKTKNVLHFADRILDKLSTPMKVAGVDVVMTASVGIVLNSPEYENSEEYIQDADIAMYHAKSRGKGRYEVFTSSRGLRARSRLTLEKELNQAISKKEFLLYYQTIIELEHMNIIGFESLLRWEKGNGEILHPHDFLPVLEDTGMLFDLGTWVFSEGCKNVAAWQRTLGIDPPLSVSINVSSSQLTHPQFVPMVKETMDHCPFDTNHLIIEVTENILIREISLATRILHELQELGVRIHLDDFGTGFSSLSYLRNLPIDAIKIDREFIDQIDPEKNDQGLLNLIISIAEKLEMDTIAEGVETEIQAQILRDMGCLYGQGFYFKEGQNAKDTEKYLNKYKKTMKTMAN
jgi:diguanylate cyclase (GGDEF)-like protein